MITVILLKLGYAAVGAVVGWFAKHFQVMKYINQALPPDAEARARVDENRTPVERSK